jgi:hypothetical protein
VEKTNAADFTKLIDGDDVHDNSKTRILGDDSDETSSSDEEDSSEETESENTN